MADVEIRRVRSLWGRHVFVDVPFRIHGGDPGWIPPLRLSVYDRISKKHPAMLHQDVALWVAYRYGQPVGRIAACVDRDFNSYQDVRWGWVGFYDTFDDPEVSDALFATACGWSAEQGMDTCVGPANFTTNDELGLLVEGFDRPPTLLTLQNPRYYEPLWERAGWEKAMDLRAYQFVSAETTLSDRQRKTLDRIRARSGVTTRSMRMDDFDQEVSKFFEVYNAAWSKNWGFAPMPEIEIRHLAKQLKPILRPDWAIGLEDAQGRLIGVALALPDMNKPMQKVRNGRLLPTGWFHLLKEKRHATNVRVWALGIRPDLQNLALGPILLSEIIDRVGGDPYIPGGEASWMLDTNYKINKQLEAIGGVRSKTWRLYQRPAAAPIRA